MRTCQKILLIALCFFSVSAMSSEEAENTFKVYSSLVAQDNWVQAVKLHPPGELEALAADLGFLVENAQLREAFFSGKTEREVNKLTSQQLTAQYFEKSFEILQSQGVSLKKNPPSVIGSVKESDNLVHVVYKESSFVNGRLSGATKVASLLKTPNGWYVKIPGEITAGIKSLKQRFSR